MRAITLRIGGMSCDHCERAVRAALQDLPGVVIDKVSIGSASVQLDPARITVDRLISAIGDAGYEVLEPIPW